MSISLISNSSDWWSYLTNSTSTTKSSSSDTFSLLSAESSSRTTKSTGNSKESEIDPATLLAMLSSMSGGMQSISPTSDSGASSEIKDFLDKVKAGTVTDADLTSMQSTLSSLMPPPPPESSSTSSTSSSTLDIQSVIKSFLDKVKEGTVTDSDLKTTMQAELASAQSDATAYKEYAAVQDDSAFLQPLLSIASSAYENSYQTNSQQNGTWSI